MTKLKGPDLFWKYVDVRGLDECWPWVGSRPRGAAYGMWWGDGGRIQSHRAAYIRWFGSIPEGMHVDHSRALGCQGYDCNNPHHLEAVPQTVNNRRAWETRREMKTA